MLDQRQRAFLGAIDALLIQIEAHLIAEKAARAAGESLFLVPKVGR